MHNVCRFHFSLSLPISPVFSGFMSSPPPKFWKPFNCSTVRLFDCLPFFDLSGPGFKSHFLLLTFEPSKVNALESSPCLDEEQEGWQTVGSGFSVLLIKDHVTLSKRNPLLQPHPPLLKTTPLPPSNQQPGPPIGGRGVGGWLRITTQRFPLP